jgi:tetraacyldisaccharide 4'-kinase
VLTRGYGRADPQSQVVVSDGSEVLAGAQDSGDEPYLLAQNLTGVAAVISNANRLAAGEWAIKNLGSEVFVLDDGFQHMQLARDLDIVTIDATNPWGGGSALPYGRLREPRAGLSRADCVVITRTDQVESTDSLRGAIRQLAGEILVLNSLMTTSEIRRLDGQNVDRASLLDQTVAAFCGVGNPTSFFNHLNSEGFRTAFRREFPDHHNYNQTEIDQLVNNAKTHGAAALITTAKDAMKLSNLELELPCYVLDIQISIHDAERLVDMIRNASLKRQG